MHLALLIRKSARYYLYFFFSILFTGPFIHSSKANCSDVACASWQSGPEVLFSYQCTPFWEVPILGTLTPGAPVLLGSCCMYSTPNNFPVLT